jgi:hypothetical protein
MTVLVLHVAYPINIKLKTLSKTISMLLQCHLKPNTVTTDSQCLPVPLPGSWQSRPSPSDSASWLSFIFPLAPSVTKPCWSYLVTASVYFCTLCHGLVEVAYHLLLDVYSGLPTGLLAPLHCRPVVWPRALSKVQTLSCHSASFLALTRQCSQDQVQSLAVPRLNFWGSWWSASTNPSIM